MHFLKSQCERVTAHTFEPQVADLHVLVALINLFTQLWRSTTAALGSVASMRLTMGSYRPSVALRAKAKQSGFCVQVARSR